MNRALITYTIDHLKDLHADGGRAKRFDLESWGNSLKVHAPDAEENDCGFAGCFLGWATHEQWYLPHGLDLRFVEGEMATAMTAPRNRYLIEVFGHRSEPRFHQFIHVTPGKHAGGAISAVAYLLGLNKRTLELVVYSEHYGGNNEITALDVAQRLEWLLEIDEDEFVREIEGSTAGGEDD